MGTRFATRETGDSSVALKNSKAQHLMQQRLAPGVCVLASPTHLIYVNHKARQLMRQMSAAEPARDSPRPSKGLLPTSLQKISVEIFRCLRTQVPTTDWEQCEVKRLAGDPKHPLLIRGFGIPDP